MILIIIREIYPAAEPDALVDILPIDVVVPLDAVQKASSADQQRDVGKKMIVTDTTRKERTKRVVVPLADTPQKRDCRPSPERVNSRTATFRRPTLPVLVRARTGMGTQHNSGEALASWMCTCVSNAAITQHKSTPWRTTHLHFIVTYGDKKTLDKTFHA